jgi:hypothetical protein
VLTFAAELEKPAQDISKAVLSTKLEQALRASSAIHEAPNVLDRLDIQLLAPSPVRSQLSAASQFCSLRLFSVACLVWSLALELSSIDNALCVCYCSDVLQNLQQSVDNC